MARTAHHRGRVSGQSTREHPFQKHCPRWSSCNPQSLTIQSFRHACDSVYSAILKRRLRGMGMDRQARRRLARMAIRRSWIDKLHIFDARYPECLLQGVTGARSKLADAVVQVRLFCHLQQTLNTFENIFYRLSIYPTMLFMSEFWPLQVFVCPFQPLESSYWWVSCRKVPTWSVVVATDSTQLLSKGDELSGAFNAESC